MLLKISEIDSDFQLNIIFLANILIEMTIKDKVPIWAYYLTHDCGICSVSISFEDPGINPFCSVTIYQARYNNSMPTVPLDAVSTRIGFCPLLTTSCIPTIHHIPAGIKDPTRLFEVVNGSMVIKYK
jgi:hypothetical protein